jgi:hypothetical protein
VRWMQSHDRERLQYILASQSVVTLYRVSNALRRCFASSSWMYLTAKSSTTRQNVMSRVLCRQMPVMCLHDEYPEMARCWTSCSYASIPDWGRLCMPLLISTNTCHLCTYSSRLYCSIIDCGMEDRVMRMYSYRGMGVPK